MTEGWTTDVPHPPPEVLVELIARRFDVIGEPMRFPSSPAYLVSMFTKPLSGEREGWR